MSGRMLFPAALMLSAGFAQAGGIERSHSPYAILWEKGNYAELSFGHLSPKATGTFTHPLAGALGSGDILPSFNQTAMAVKYAIRPDLDVAFVLDQPMGAKIAYPTGLQSGAAPYPIGGSNAEIKSYGLSALLRYRFDENWSVHGGLKLQRTRGNVEIFNPNLPGGRYTMQTSSENDLGFLIGGAYEVPDIALRVALTYQSAITHDFRATESLPNAGVTRETTLKNKTPQSLTLDFQTGIMKDTLLFGSVRWKEWSAFDITPAFYSSFGSSDPQNPLNSLVNYPRNVVSLNLGLGRKFTENFSGSISVGYEKANGFRTSNLGPHDGMRSLTIGGSYTKDNWKITGGVTYAKLGEATTYLPIGGSFKDNKMVALGVKVGFSF